MLEEFSTYPCPLCYTPYKNQAAADRCFMEHTCDEHLLWATRELYRLSGELYNLHPRLDGVVAKYELDDQWY